MAPIKYAFESHHRPGRHWTTKQKDKLRCELRAVGEASLPSVPNYNCFSESPTAFDNKVMVIAREGGSTGRIVAFVSCILLTIDGIGTVLHTGLTCVLPEKRRQGLQGRLFTHLHRLLCAEYPSGIWFSSVSSSLCSLVSLLLATSNVFPSPDVVTPQDTHVRIATAISQNHRAELDIEGDVTFDPERFLFYSSPDSPWWKDPANKDYHHRNKILNNFYVSAMEQVTGSEVLQVGFMDPMLYLRVGRTSIRVAHASTAYSVLEYGSKLSELLSMIGSHFLSSRSFWRRFTNLRKWSLYQQMLRVKMEVKN